MPSGGYSSYSSTPVAVTGLESGVKKIAVSSSPLPFENHAGHACAIVGSVAECWGDNEYGQLGRDTIPAQSYGITAAPVSGLATGVTDITSGDEHSCAVVNGAAYCWGSNFGGELGNGSIPVGYPAYSQAPVAVQGLGSGVVALSASGNHTCAVVNNDAVHPVKCWGSNLFGELGNGNATYSAVPVNAEFFPCADCSEPRDGHHHRRLAHVRSYRDVGRDQDLLLGRQRGRAARQRGCAHQESDTAICRRNLLERDRYRDRQRRLARLRGG